MADRAPFLKTRYSGYHHRHVPQEDTELTHVGPDTPCGEYLRRFWQPICYSDDLRTCRWRSKSSARSWWCFATAAAPSACWNATARIAAPRSNSAWSARRASAAATTAGCSTSTARSSRRRASRPTSTLKDRLCHGAYPVHEAHGLVFAYMGPPEQMPAFPDL